MKQLLPLFIFITLLFFSGNAYADTGRISGKVVNSQGEPVSYVSIYIKELSMGASTNESGEFDFEAENGTYTCYFQHLSYETTTVQAKIPGSGPVTVRMADKVYDLPMTSIGTKQEDPAYDMVRKAIGMAPFYRNQLDAYRADVYIKGTAKVDKISGVVKMMARKELKKANIKEGEKYLYESLSEVSLQNGKYVQNVKSVSSTLPPGINVNVGLANYNLYQPEIHGIISPLSPQAFSHYNFKYEGFSVEGDNIINKIRVIPKRENKMTLKGHIYLSEGHWNIHRFELSGEIMGANFTNRQSYGELEKDIWMPISNNFDVYVSVAGNKGSATYVSSMKYRSFTVNPTVKNRTAASGKVSMPAAVAATRPRKQTDKSKKLEEQIESIVNKGSVTNREAYKLSRLTEKKKAEDHKSLPDSLKEKESLNLSERYVFKTDSMAKSRDTVYWNKIRPIPLMADEVSTYRRLDSVTTAHTQTSDSVNKQSFSVFKILFPSSFPVFDSTARLSYSGLVWPFNLDYNIVDGLTYKQWLYLRKNFRDSTRLNLYASGTYAFARKRMLFEGSGSYIYYPEKQATIHFAGGRRTADFNSESGLYHYDNTLSTLLFRRNYINFYESDYLSLSHVIEPVNGLMTTVGLGYNVRRVLQNNSDFSIFYSNSREFRPNIPDNAYITNDPLLIRHFKTALLNVSVSYTPKQYYREYRRRKYNVRSDFPTITMRWKKGVKGVFNSESDFDQLELNVRQNINLGAMRSFNYSATAGWFPNNSAMHFADFKHFNIKEFGFSFTGLNHAFHLLDTYEPATNEWYATASASYNTPYLLLKYLPLLNRTLIEEFLYVAYLTTPLVKNYTEISYGLTNIGLVGSAGVFVGFDKFSYANWGFKFAVYIGDR